MLLPHQGPHCAGLQAETADTRANVPLPQSTPRTDITNRSLPSSPPDQLGGHYKWSGASFRVAGCRVTHPDLPRCPLAPCSLCVPRLACCT